MPVREGAADVRIGTGADRALHAEAQGLLIVAARTRGSQDGLELRSRACRSAGRRVMPVGGRQGQRHRGVLAALVVDEPELDLGGVADLPGEAHLLARARAGASRMGEPPDDRFAAMEVERRLRSRIELDPDAAGEHGRAGGRLELERPALGARRDDDADLGVGRPRWARRRSAYPARSRTRRPLSVPRSAGSCRGS